MADESKKSIEGAMRSPLRTFVNAATVATVILSLIGCRHDQLNQEGVTGSSPPISQSAPIDTRVAVLDTHYDTRPWLNYLSDRGIKVVARYYSRRPQRNLPNKRIAYNDDGDRTEAQSLLDAGFSILSVYQYRSSSRKKFVSGLEDTGSTEKEAIADAEAALNQADTIKQPEKTAIYFGVDFDLIDRDVEAKSAVKEYFRKIREIIGDKYKIGVYGNGVTHNLLLDPEEKLVDYTWISASVGFSRTPEFYSTGQWNLFQNQIDRFAAGREDRCPDWSRWFPYDTNVQNPENPDIGAWGGSPVPQGRVSALFNTRRFVSKADGAAPVHVAPDSGAPLIKKDRCRYNSRTKKWSFVKESKIRRKRNVRVAEHSGAWLQVDVDDDGVFDGFMQERYLSTLTRMPD